jgi:hypothetical protein
MRVRQRAIGAMPRAELERLARALRKRLCDPAGAALDAPRQASAAAASVWRPAVPLGETSRQGSALELPRETGSPQLGDLSLLHRHHAPSIATSLLSAPATCGVVQQPDEAAQRAALSAFYAATVGAQWVISTNWLRPDAHVCTWAGVICNGTAVIGMQMLYNNVQGTLPAALFSGLPALQLLVLEGTPLSGTLPAAALAQLSCLQYLHFTQTEISGTLDSALAALTTLLSLVRRALGRSGTAC